jgi:RNA polymerase sigma factor (sigma-70 family)
MATAFLHNVLAYLRSSAAPDRDGGAGDGELLRRFVTLRDEAAFEALLRRHGAMVLGVCWRVLQESADAEDAFQATFLVLLRKAPGLLGQQSVGSFLHGVALRTALHARSDRANRRKHESQVAAMAATQSSPGTDGQDLRPVLDEEVARLPRKYRAAVVAWYLEGKSYDEAARECRCSRGTIASRLARARERLRRRLVGRGVVLSAASFTAAVQAQAAAILPPPLLGATLRAVVHVHAGRAAELSAQILHLAEGVGKTMSLGKTKLVVVAVLSVCALGVVGIAASRGLRPEPPAEERAAAPNPIVATGTGAWQHVARLGSVNGPFAYSIFAPDGSTLITIDPNGLLRLWDTSTWELRGRYDLRKRYGENYTAYTPFAPDGRRIALFGSVADPDHPGKRLPEVTLIDTEGREVGSLKGRGLKFAPDGRLVTVEGDTLTLWDLSSPGKKLVLKAAAPLRGFEPEFSKDGRLVAAPTENGRVHLWETATGKQRAVLEGFYPFISPDGKSLLTHLPGGTVKLWDATSGRERAVFRGPPGKGLWADFSADGRYLLTWAALALKSNGQPDVPKPGSRRKGAIKPVEARLWDAATGAEVLRLPGADNSNPDEFARFAPDGKTVAYRRLETDETDRHTIVLWDVAAGRERAVLRPKEGTQFGQFSADGKTFITADPTATTLQVWEVATGRRLPDLNAPIAPAWMHFSPDGRLLAGPPVSPGPAGAGPSDLLVFRLSDRPLPPPVLRGEPARPTPSAQVEEPRRTKAGQALEDLRKESAAEDARWTAKVQGARTPALREEAERLWTEALARSAARALAIARANWDDTAAVEALEFALRRTSGGFSGPYVKVRDEALALVRKEFLRLPAVSQVLFWLGHQQTDAAYDLLAEFAQASPHRIVQGRAAHVLATSLAEEADAVRMLRLMPEILKLPEARDKLETLQRLAQSDPEALERRAEKWFERVRDKFADVTVSEHQPELLGKEAERGLFALRQLGIGKTAPDIEGDDLDGKRFKLSHYRGKVLVLIFCGNWCGPCRQMHQHLQRMVERLAGQPFALLEVNSDEDPEAIRRTMRKEKRTWRCWFDGGKDGPIARRWDVHHWPTVFVLDAKGLIRYKELRDQPLEQAVQSLLKESRR